MRYAVDIVALMLLYVLVFYRRWKRKGRDVLLVNTLMYIYLGFVAYFTLMPVITALPFVFNHSYVPMNLEPFIDMTMERGDYMRQIVLNVIMTVPFGILAPLVEGKRPSFWKTVMYTFFLSLGIELLQPLISNSRSSDVTDLITNVIGGAIGYGVYVIFRPAIEKILSQIRSESGKSV